jgi:hypothetical protein
MARPLPRPRSSSRPHWPGRALLLTCGLLLTAAPTAAQEGGGLFQSATLTTGARALALGGVASPGGADADAVFLHPALANSAGGIRLGYSSFGEGARGLSLATGTNWFGSAVHLSIRSLNYDLAQPGTVSPAAAGGLGGLSLAPGATGDPVSETAATLTLGREVAGFQFGVSGRSILQQRSGVQRRSVQSLDLGVARRLGPTTLAVSGRNLGSASGLPAEAVLGLGSQALPVGPLDIAVAAQLRAPDGGDVTAGGGLEIGYWPIQGRTFIARIGVRDGVGDLVSPWSLGAAFQGDEIRIEWAWVQVEDARGFHRISLGWN